MVTICVVHEAKTDLMQLSKQNPQSVHVAVINPGLIQSVHSFFSQYADHYEDHHENETNTRFR